MMDGRIRVLVLVSEILSAKTLVPIVRVLMSESDMSVKVINDGFCIEFVQSLGLPVEYILEDFETRIDQMVSQTSVVLMGKSYVQPSEYILLRRAAHWGVPVMMVVPDMGVDIVRAKLRGIGGESSCGIPWPKLLVADERTRASLRYLNVSNERIVEFGNPYFDELYEELERDKDEWDALGVGYFSTPFELDFQRGILPANYRQQEMVEDIKRACEALGQPLIGKRHPQVENSVFDGMEVFEGTPLEMIRKIRVAVGCYSTTLLEAYAAGIPTISYQPWSANIRQDVFDARIPIVKSASELGESLRLVLSRPQSRRVTTFLTYNPGCSIAVALQLVREHGAYSARQTPAAVG